MWGFLKPCKLTCELLSGSFELELVMSIHLMILGVTHFETSPAQKIGLSTWLKRCVLVLWHRVLQCCKILHPAMPQRKGQHIRAAQQMLVAKDRKISTFATRGWLCPCLASSFNPLQRIKRIRVNCETIEACPSWSFWLLLRHHIGPWVLQPKRGIVYNSSGSMCYHFFPDFSCRFDTKAFQEFPVSSTKSSNRLSVSSRKGSIPEKGINARSQCLGMYYMPCQTGRSLRSCTSSHTFPIQC